MRREAGARKKFVYRCLGIIKGGGKQNLTIFLQQTYPLMQDMGDKNVSKWTISNRVGFMDPIPKTQKMQLKCTI